MVLKRTEESLQRKQASPTSAFSRTGHGGKQWVLNELPASGTKILREVGLTGCGFGSLVLVAPGPANQLRNSTLQCKLKFLISTVCQRGFAVWFGFFWIQQLVTEVKYFHGSYSAVASSGGKIKVCVWLIRPSSTCKAQLFPKCRSLGPFKTLKK